MDRLVRGLGGFSEWRARCRAESSREESRGAPWYERSRPLPFLGEVFTRSCLARGLPWTEEDLRSLKISLGGEEDGLCRALPTRSWETSLCCCTGATSLIASFSWKASLLVANSSWSCFPTFDPCSLPSATRLYLGVAGVFCFLALPYKFIEK